MNSPFLFVAATLMREYCFFFFKQQSPPKLTLQKPQVDWIILLILSVVWGCSFYLIKKSLIAFNPIQVASLRVVFSALAFFPFFLKQFRSIQKTEWMKLLLVGLLGSGIPAFCYAVAQTEISSAVTGILNSLTPLWTMLVGWAFFRTGLHAGKILGVLIGLIGATFLIATLGTIDAQVNFFYAFFIVAGTLCYGTSGNLVKTYLTGLSSFKISSIAFVLIGPPAAVILFWSDSIGVILSHPKAFTSLLAILALSLIGTVAASILYFQLVKRTDALFASSVSYLIPIVAVVLGLLDGEIITYLQLVGFILIVSGIYLTRVKTTRQPVGS